MMGMLDKKESTRNQENNETPVLQLHQGLVTGSKEAKVEEAKFQAILKSRTDEDIAASFNSMCTNSAVVLALILSIVCPSDGTNIDPNPECVWGEAAEFATALYGLAMYSLTLICLCGIWFYTFLLSQIAQVPAGEVKNYVEKVGPNLTFRATVVSNDLILIMFPLTMLLQLSIEHPAWVSVVSFFLSIYVITKFSKTFRNMLIAPKNALLEKYAK